MATCIAIYEIGNNKKINNNMTQLEKENYKLLLKYYQGHVNIIKKFICFLQNNNALGSYIKYRQKARKYYSSVFSLPKRMSNQNYKKAIAPYFIESAFSWSDTKEDYDYWLYLSNKWQDILRRMD